MSMWRQREAPLTQAEFLLDIVARVGRGVVMFEEIPKVVHAYLKTFPDNDQKINKGF